MRPAVVRVTAADSRLVDLAQFASQTKFRTRKLYKLMRNMLFCLPTETSHTVALRAMDMAYATRLSGLLAPSVSSLKCPTTVMGIEFPNPVGLAAGLDKNADHIDALAALGFGFIEVGTLTPLAQPGNPKPRLFRLAAQQAIINRMGFNNKGIDYALERIRSSRFRGVLGINIGKNFSTPVERAADDYLICMRKAYPCASYIVVNLSSPNTPGLRSLQFGEELRSLLQRLKEEQGMLAAQYRKHVPLVVKIAPDLTPAEIDLIAVALLENGIEGVIATNTTLDRSGVQDSPLKDQAGGLSGAPLRDKSTEVIRHLCQTLAGRIPVIGVGGVSSGADAAEKLAAGAVLVQIYTGFIYSGPDLIADSVKAAIAYRESQA
jgi:dihydroorotate dehydrogenase